MWLEQQVSLYRTMTDNKGQAKTLREIIYSECANDIGTITAIRKLDRIQPDYKKKQAALKSKLQCFTPSALLKSKAKDSLGIISMSGLMQLDFDPADISEYNLEELKQCIFKLPFIAFCGKSVSGDGFYSLVSIAEPERLKEYAEHCFKVLVGYGIKADTSKGRNPHDLRFVSYDADMLVRDNPEPLKIPPLKPALMPSPKKTNNRNVTETNARVSEWVNQITSAGVDITQGYDNWLSIAFALVDEFGEAGRNYFHNLSSVSGQYNPAEADKQYTHCLKQKPTGQRVTIATLFHKFNQAGGSNDIKFTSY